MPGKLTPGVYIARSTQGYGGIGFYSDKFDIAIGYGNQTESLSNAQGKLSSRMHSYGGLLNLKNKIGPQGYFIYGGNVEIQRGSILLNRK